MSASAAPVLFLKLQDETFDVGQFLMQVLTATLLFPVTWVPLQRKSAHVKKKKSILPSCYHSQAWSYLPELLIFLDYLFFQHLKQKMLALSLTLRKKSPILLGTKVTSYYAKS